MKTTAAVLRVPGKPWEITELDLDEPKSHEVLVRFMASGMCHSDEHIRESGGSHIRMPLVGGHEGAGIVESVGSAVQRVQPGDHIVTSYIPACGHCRYCSTGRQNLCDRGLYAGRGCLQDETFRFHQNGEDFGAFCVVGSFSQFSVVSEYSCIRMDDDVPFEVACLVGCGATTGWASAVYVADVRVGETVVVFGTGGVGMNAVQGARLAGAKNVIAIDPVPFKREQALRFGATLAFAGPDEARDKLVEISRGQLADKIILTVGVLAEADVSNAVSMCGKAGTVVITSVSPPDEKTVSLTGSPLVGYVRRIQGALFGNANPLYDVPKLLGLYKSGDMKLEELITRRYPLEEINEGYQDMLDGKNIRGVIVHEH
ncbi:MAG: NDMA-dependent alcohol dehydrogenase [Acidimicrobiales bacterium]